VEDPVPRRSRSLIVLSALVAPVLTGCGATGEPELTVAGAAQAAEPVAGSSQIVLELRNTGDGDDVLLEADTPAALGVEFHLTSIEDGRASMGQLQEVEVPAGESVQFRPGALHLMLVVPDETVVLGEEFDLTLSFERSEPMSVPVEVVDLLDLAEAGFDEPEATS
jgi:periplasmic copper chaperone A